MGATDRYSLIVESATRGEAELRRFEETMNRVADVVERSQRRTSTASQKAAQDSSRALTQAQAEASSAGDSMAASALKFTAAASAIAGVGVAIKSATVDAALLAARTNTLTVVTQQLASANNLYSAGVLTQARAIKQQGIFTGDALAVVNKMIFAQLDLAKSTNLARVAQDAAVIAGINSSEALEGIIHGIVTRQPEVLRTYGIIVNFEQEYSKAARKLGRDLTDTEKTQIAMNRVLTEGGKITGAYEAAMGTAGKQVTSLKRYVDEASNAIGSRFENELSATVRLLADGAKFAENHADAFALLAKSTVALTAATTGYIAAKTVANSLESGAGVAAVGRLVGAASPAGLVTAAGIGAAFATMQQLSDLEDAYKRTFDEPREAAARLNQEIAKIIIGLKDGTSNAGQFRDALSRAMRQEAEGRGRKLLPEFEGMAAMDAEKAGSLNNPDFLKFLKSRGLQDTIPLLGRGGSVATFARQQLGRQYLDESYGANPTGIRVIKPPTAADLEAMQAELAKKAKAIEDNVQDFVMRSFDSGLDALDRITIQTAKIWAAAVTPGQRKRIEAAAMRMYDSALSDQSGKIFDKSRSRQTFLELEAADAAKKLEDPNRGVPVFVARPDASAGTLVARYSYDAKGNAVQQGSEMMTPERLQAYGEGLLNRDKQRLALIQQQVEFEAKKGQLLAGPGGEVAALERTVSLRLAAIDIMSQMTTQIDVQAERTKILQDRELAILEIQQRRREAVRNATEQAFDAAVAGGAGISALVRSQGLGIGRTIAGNLGVQVFSGLSGKLAFPGQTNTDGTPNFLGKLLANTPFAADPLKTATDRNTEATNLNTAALLGRVGGAGGGGIAGALSALPGVGGMLSGLPSYFPTLSNVGPRAGVLPGYSGTAADSAVNRAVTEQLGVSTPVAESSNLGRNIGIVGAGLTAGFGVYSGVKQGGLRGGLTATSSGLGGIASILALADVSGPAAPILAGAALGLGVVQMLLGDPKKKRDKQLDQMIEEARYNSNSPASYDLDMFGRGIDTDISGRARVVIVNQTVQAWDPSSFIDHADDIASATEVAFERGHPVIQAAREAILGGNV